MPIIVSNHTGESSTKLIILSSTMRSAVLRCIARSYPLYPVVAWEADNKETVSNVTVIKFTGYDGANYMKTEITVSRPGSYSCLINHTLERRDFVVVGKTSVISV